METMLAQRKAQTGDNFILLQPGTRAGKRIGIYGKGSCDLKVLYGCAPLLGSVLEGPCCILTEGTAADSRSDILLQALDSLPAEATAEVTDRLGLAADYFLPRLFEPTFSVDGVGGSEEFPKTVVCLSMAADVNRVAYRHREHGFLADPGGGWLNQSLELTLKDLPAVHWFRQAFQSTGRLPVERFVENFRRIVRLVQQSSGAHVLVFNTLTVDPGSPLHNYQFVKQCHALRRREFHLALADLSRELDFSIVDVDRVLKNAGVREQIDFGHPPPVFNAFLAREVVRLLRDRGIV